MKIKTRLGSIHAKGNESFTCKFPREFRILEH